MQNSTETGALPSFPGEVVGLCGQGGRHPYFRIPVNLLDGALTRLERARYASGANIEKAIGVD